MHWLLTLRIDQSGFLVPLYALTAAVALYLLFKSPRPRWLVRVVGASVLGLIVGYVVAWLVSDVWDVFGLPLTAITRMWVAFAFAGVFLAVANLWGTRWWRKTVAIVFIPLVLISAGAGINVDFGAYRDLTDALGIMPYPTLHASKLGGHAGPMDPNLATDWKPPKDMPAHGAVGAVTIPATVSHFNARQAVVYLPPAALVRNPPKLPVVMLLSGQPGAPADTFTSGDAPATYDAYAKKHHGLAPIVVAPDQLSHPGQNPMCVDSPLGNSATYLTVDVPNWIKSHLNVAESGRYWAVGGYSEGGTCAMQFGAGRPDQFGSFIPVLSELAPTIGAKTVQEGFGGSQAKYDAAKPLNMLKKNAPYPDSWAIFGAGRQDPKYLAFAKTLNAASERAGITSRVIVSPNSGHDWNTVRYVWHVALPLVADHMGLAG